MAFNASPDPRLDRPGNVRSVAGVRNVTEKEGLFMLPEDTGEAAWDLDPTNGDGDLVIPDDIDGRTADEAPNVSGADMVSILLVSLDSQDLSFSVDWLPSADGDANSRSEGPNDSDLFGPDTKIRTNFFTGGRHMKLTVTSEVADGTQNRVAGSVESH